MNRCATASLPFVLLLLGACASRPAAPTPGVLNSRCPISGEALDGKGPTIFFNQATIGFCCARCVAEFAKLDVAEMQKKIDAAR